MNTLSVYVTGNAEDARLLTLPVNVHAPDGTLLGQGTASPSEPARFALPADLKHVHVLGKLPDGTLIQEIAETAGARDDISIALRVGDLSPHEWLQWLMPFRSLEHLQSPATAPGPDSEPVRKIGKVWMTLWTMHDGQWEADDVRLLDRLKDGGMQQIVLDVPNTSQLLQVGGDELAWRLISLPPGGPVRIALTRAASDEGDTLDITMARAQPDNELIMSYLARGHVEEAGRLAEAWHAGDPAHYRETGDAVSAAATAYVLLKSRHLQQHRDWVGKLADWFPHLPDGAIIAAALALQEEHATEARVRELIDTALARGLPLFAMGATVLVETMAAVHRGSRESKRFHAAYLAAQAYARACCSRGAYFAFYGKSPGEPAWVRIYGSEDAPETAPVSARDGDFTRAVIPEVIGNRPIGVFGQTEVELPGLLLPGQGQAAQASDVEYEASPASEYESAPASEYEASPASEYESAPDAAYESAPQVDASTATPGGHPIFQRINELGLAKLATTVLTDRLISIVKQASSQKVSSLSRQISTGSSRTGASMKSGSLNPRSGQTIGGIISPRAPAAGPSSKGTIASTKGSIATKGGKATKGGIAIRGSKSIKGTQRTQRTQRGSGKTTTSRDWATERLSHAVTLFDGDE